MVKAIRYHEFGGPEVMKLEEIELGDPGPGQIRVRHTAIGLNFLDGLIREGKYPVLPELPAVPGSEAAAVIEAVGDGVEGFEPGQRVAYAGILPGAYAEGRLIDASEAVVLPDSISDDDAAAGYLKGLTVEYLVNRCYPVSEGEVAIVHAAAGGVGLMMCQWLRYLGVTVIGTTTTEEKKELILANGAAHALNSRTESISDLAREVTDGAGVEVVYDSVGPAVWDESLKSLRPRGYYVNFGNASGLLKPIDAIELQMHGSLFFTKASMRYYQLNRAELDAAAMSLFDVMSKGAVKAVIGQRYALADAAQAQVDTAEGRTTGSTILVP